jgi:hypothetical protein
MDSSTPPSDTCSPRRRSLGKPLGDSPARSGAHRGSDVLVMLSRLGNWPWSRCHCCCLASLLLCPSWAFSTAGIVASAAILGCSLGHTEGVCAGDRPVLWPEPNQFLVGVKTSPRIYGACGPMPPHHHSRYDLLPLIRRVHSIVSLLSVSSLGHLCTVLATRAMSSPQWRVGAAALRWSSVYWGRWSSGRS